jgi:metal-dependent HD superfamily phosphatase/phosphodiesterase
MPAVNEYLTVQRAVQRVADSGPSTVAEARIAFDKQKEIEYAISSISGSDLDISKDGGRVVVAFAYNREIPLYGPVYLLLKFEGRSR